MPQLEIVLRSRAFLSIKKMMNRSKILIVEDCDDTRKVLSDFLRRDYDVEAVRDAESALERIAKTFYDVVIVDLGLPGMDGHRFCTSVRSIDSGEKIVIIIHSGRIEIEEKLMGFSLGADDYALKPCESRELKARIDRHLHTRRLGSVSARRVQAGPFSGDLAKQSISYQLDNDLVEVQLSALEFRLIHFFMTHVDHVLSREQILNEVWGNSRYVGDRSVDSMISKLRLKLGPYGTVIQSVHGTGYRFGVSGMEQHLPAGKKAA